MLHVLSRGNNQSRESAWECGGAVALYRQRLRGCVFHAAFEAGYSTQPQPSAHQYKLVTTIPLIVCAVKQKSVPYPPRPNLSSSSSTQEPPVRRRGRHPPLEAGNAILA